MRRFRSAVAVPVAAIVLFASAQPSWAVRVVQVKGESLVSIIDENLTASNWSEAIAQVETLLARRPDDGGLHFRAACALSNLGDADRAADHLMSAIKMGYSDWRRIRFDPMLFAIHEHPRYKSILKAREIADELLGPWALEHWQRKHGTERYCYQTDETRRLHFAAALSCEALASICDSVNVQLDHLTATLFADTCNDPVFVALAAPEDFSLMLRDRHAHGVYQHTTRRLVVRCAPGQTGDRALRHELTHMLHQHHMDALGQEHAMWIQEGLATLYEEFVVAADGGVEFPVNDRDAAAAYLAQHGRLVSLATLATMSQSEFQRNAATAYPQARSFLRFVASHDKLEAWYEAYIRNVDTDQTGIAAMQQVFHASPAQIESQWRSWLEAGSNAPSAVKTSGLESTHEPKTTTPQPAPAPSS